MRDAGWAGVLATAGGVVFSGDHDGTFFAADSTTGKKLFEFQTGVGDLSRRRRRYLLDGRQYVVMPSGRDADGVRVAEVEPSRRSSRRVVASVGVQRRSACVFEL